MHTLGDLAKANLSRMARRPTKRAFVPMGPEGPQPMMAPGMSGGAPPGLPADPSMMAGGGMPMDPAMLAGGGMPMDPGALASPDPLTLIQTQLADMNSKLDQMMGFLQAIIATGGKGGGGAGRVGAGGDVSRRLEAIEAALGLSNAGGGSFGTSPGMGAGVPNFGGGLMASASAEPGDVSRSIGRTIGKLRKT